MTQKTLGDYSSTGHECEICGKSFDNIKARNGHRASHSDEISHSVNCDYCGGEFEKKPASQRKSENDFCSQDCYHSWNRETGARAGENNPQYKEPVTLVCEWCECEYEVPPVHKDSRFCSQECQSRHKETILGADHPLYGGGYEYYVAIRRALGPTGWESLRKKYNGDECEMCGAETSPRGRDLSLHHIVPVLSGGVNHEDNFMTLCEPCHSKAEAYCSDLPGFEKILVE